MKKTAFNLIQYSALSLSFLSLHESRGQAMYTDIDPDIVLDSDGELGLVDMDNEGVIDFAFLNTSGTATPTSFPSFFEGIWVGPNFPQNGIAGYLSYQSGYGGFTQYFPYALLNGFMISSELPFHHWGFQRMAYRRFYDTTWFSGTWEGGYWYPEVLDHYLGIKFLDNEGDYHYGWIRCDVKDEGRTLVIKDYAYEDKPDVPIAAGDMIGNTIEFAYDKGNINTTIAENELQNVTVYSFDQTVFIQLEELSENTNVQIMNLAGDIVYENALTELYNEIILEAAKGYYIVNINAGDKRFTQKVFIN